MVRMSYATPSQTISASGSSTESDGSAHVGAPAFLFSHVAAQFRWTPRHFMPFAWHLRGISSNNPLAQRFRSALDTCAQVCLSASLRTACRRRGQTNEQAFGNAPFGPNMPREVAKSQGGFNDENARGFSCGDGRFCVGG